MHTEFTRGGEMFQIKNGHMLLLQFLALMIGLMQFVPCVAIDNPDTPDIVSEFQSRASVYET